MTSALAVGNASNASATGAVALGDNAQSSGVNSVALGAGSTDERPRAYWGLR